VDVKVIRMTDRRPAQAVRGRSVDGIARTLFGKTAQVSDLTGHVNPEVKGYSVYVDGEEAGRIFAPK
jgi:hypothetical protein